MEEKKVDNSFVYNKEDLGLIGKAKSRVSEFFFHIMQYGGFNFENGVIYVWLNPTTFFPINTFTVFQIESEAKFGYEFNEFLYWLGKMTGKNSTLVLAKRYGFQISDLPSFLNGATQDGFGYMTIEKVDTKSKPLNGIVTGTNNIFAETLKQKYGTQKKPIDYYICGIITGGAEPLFWDNKIGKGVETTCIAKGDQKCTFTIEEINNPERSSLIAKAKLDEDLILKNALKLYSQRKGSFKVYKKEVKFGDGTFIFKDVKGIIIETYAVVIMDYVLNKLYGEEYSNILEKSLNETITSLNIKKLKDNSSNKSIQDQLNMLDILGYGHFNLMKITPNKILIKNENNPYPQEYKNLFGPTKKSVDLTCTILLKLFFKKMFDRDNNVKEIQCSVYNKGGCIFEITFK